MIAIRRSDERGRADHGWLQSRHTFSFAGYHDPDFMGFGFLRVLNHDRVAPARGFEAHGHRDMEIVSYVLAGVMEHKDSMGYGSQMRPGEVQLLSAGTGVTHSEFNASAEEPLEFLQMWILPARHGTEPRYDQRAFPEGERRGRFRLVVSPDGREGSVVIGQDARLFVSLLTAGEDAEHGLAGRSAYLHLIRGRVRLGEAVLEAGDGAALQGETSARVEALEDAELLLWDLPAV